MIRMMSKPKKVARKIIPKRAIRSVEDSYRLNKARLATVRYRAPAKKLKIIGVTGTNGKTTTCAYINEVLKAGGYKTAVYTTAFTEVNGARKPNKTHMTVASAWSVQKFMALAKKTAVDYVILEVTSHALDQQRLHGLKFETAVLTNLSQDHLDYHGTMQNYAEAKLKLLTEYGAENIVLNADDEWFGYFYSGSKGQKYTIGKSKATHQLKAANLTPDGTTYKLVSTKSTLRIKTRIVGEFNMHNSAMAVVVGQLAGLTNKQIQEGIENLWGIPGRLEPVSGGQEFTVLVDYAHTPDAIENVLKSLQAITKGSVHLVFGATGDRDKTKRPTMGEVAAKNADFIYLTDDETYTEDPATIRNMVKEGIVAAGGKNKYVEIGNRKTAIKQAFAAAKPGDVVLLAGIGHQDYRAMGGKKEPWDEREVALSLL